MNVFKALELWLFCLHLLHQAAKLGKFSFVNILVSWELLKTLNF